LKGLILWWGGFRLGGAISRKCDEIERRSQLITYRKSHVGFRFVRKSVTLNDLSGKNAHAITGNQKVICCMRNVRLMLVLLAYWQHNTSSSLITVPIRVLRGIV